MLLPGREWQEGYRFGFNKKEIDCDFELRPEKYDYGMRIYNAYIGRFLSVDAYSSKYAWYSPFQFSGNNPIRFIDMTGNERNSYMRIFEANGQSHLVLISSEDIKELVLIGYRNSISAYNDYPIPVYKTVINAKQEFIVVNETEAVGYLDGVDGGLSGPIKVDYYISAKYKSLSDAQNEVNGSNGNEKYKFYLTIGAKNLTEQRFEQGGLGSSIVKNNPVTAGCIVNGINLTIEEITAERVLVGSSERVAVIGRNMNRVNKFANGYKSKFDVKCEVWEGFDPLLSKEQNISNNKIWAESLKKEGVTVYDIGLDPEKKAIGDLRKGSGYGPETEILFNDKPVE